MFNANYTVTINPWIVWHFVIYSGHYTNKSEQKKLTGGWGLLIWKK